MGDNEQRKGELDHLLFSLEQQKLQFEQEKWRADLDLRHRELELKEIEARRRAGILGRLDPVSIGLFTATLALVGNLLTTNMQNTAKLNSDRTSQDAQIRLERERFEADLIKDYVKTKPERVDDNLKFLLESGLVVLKAPQLKIALAGGSRPSLTLSQGVVSSAGGDQQRDSCFFEADFQRSELACVQLLEAPISTRFEEASIRRRLAFVLMKLKRYEVSIDAATKAIDIDPTNSAVYNNRGFAYRRRGQLDRAIADYNKAIELDPTNAFPYNNRGLLYQDQGRLDRAVADYNKAIELDPTYSIAYSNRGTVHVDQGQLDRAIADYNKAIELDPTNATSYNNRGFVYRAQKQLDRAISDFTSAIRLDPRDAPAWRNRALALRLAGDAAAAQRDIAEAQRLAPDDSRTLYIVGILKELAGDFGSASEDYAKARRNEKNAVEWASIEKALDPFRPKR